MDEKIITMNDLPEEDQEELRKILREDILESYHEGKLQEEVLKKDGSITFEIVEEGLSDGEILAMYDNSGYWDRQIIEQYIMEWKITQKKLKETREKY